MNGKGILKKPKEEIDSSDDEQEHNIINNNININNANNSKINNNNNNNDIESESTSGRDYEEQEEALVALFEHRTKELEHLRNRVSYYTSQLEQAEQKLRDTEDKLVRVRRKLNGKKQNNFLLDTKNEVKVTSTSPGQTMERTNQRLPQCKPSLLIANVKQKSSRPTIISENARRDLSSQSSSPMKGGGDRSHGTPEQDPKSQAVGTKRKLERRDHEELVPMVRNSSSPSKIQCRSSTHISSQHTRKLRSLALCPVNDKLFITSALDGVVNLWQLQAKGSSATRLSSMDCPSPKQKRWPEDIAWHPEGNKLVAVYTADGGDNQISVLNLSKSQPSSRVTFLSEKPHVKGIVNSISFMPWDDKYFVTGGCDHAVVLWSEKGGEDTWKPKALHRNLHSSAVMGVAGMLHKQIIVSAGADKRIIGYDVLAGRVDYKHQLESKCMSVLPNPRDFNLFLVQTGTPERQLRLLDIRLRHSELHEFGWKQESSESQSALINQAWSPDGLYISSGSADPMIHIFDIRYNSHKPSQSVQAHQKRVFKAEWHSSIPLLISISSDLNIGLHKI